MISRGSCKQNSTESNINFILKFKIQYFKANWIQTLIKERKWLKTFPISISKSLFQYYCKYITQHWCLGVGPRHHLGDDIRQGPASLGTLKCQLLIKVHDRATNNYWLSTIDSAFRKSPQYKFRTCETYTQ